MRLSARLLLVLITLVAVQSVFAIIRSGTPYSIREPRTGLDDLPLVLGSWQCTEPGGRDSDAEDIAGATYSIQRFYVNAEEGVTVSAYVAIWMRYEGRYLPHEPYMCYGGAGFEIISNSTVPIRGMDGQTAKAAFLQMERDHQPAHVLYWYQLDSDVMCDVGPMQEARWKHVGNSRWPPMVKVMLDVRGTSGPTAERCLKDLGEKILDWTTKNI